MDILVSVIIVNYNVKYFLEQCLHSVERALEGAGICLPGENAGQKAGEIRFCGEVLVADNHSSDGSLDYLRGRFPRVQFLANGENLGFSRANNRALEKARGKYVLFLNPDTILAEDTLAICMRFMEKTPDAGALGVRMIDGSGRFLKESRRGFPTPWVAFCKLSGLTALFPRSAFFAGYYLGHLPEKADHAAPVLSGAFFFTRREILEKTGGFDERFFMYAEDIDLSYRIGQAGYTNYYTAATTILHFKGESTKKDSRYVRLFYRAMSQFRRKHFRGLLAGLFNAGMDLAIWMRAGLAALLQWFRKPAVREGSGPGPERRRVRLTGAAEEAGRVRVRLEAGGQWIPVTAPENADACICSEGKDFSFRDLIAALEKEGGQGFWGIHAAGSGSVVGSRSSDGRGEIVVL